VLVSRMHVGEVRERQKCDHMCRTDAELERYDESLLIGSLMQVRLSKCGHYKSATRGEPAEIPRTGCKARVAQISSIRYFLFLHRTSRLAPATGRNVPDDHERAAVVCDRSYKQSNGRESASDLIKLLLEVEGLRT
jgi:hypothetical protein